MLQWPLRGLPIKVRPWNHTFRPQSWTLTSIQPFNGHEGKIGDKGRGVSRLYSAIPVPISQLPQIGQLWGPQLFGGV